MEEDISAINPNMKNQRVKDFFINYKKKNSISIYNHCDYNFWILYLWRFAKKK